MQYGNHFHHNVMMNRNNEESVMKKKRIVKMILLILLICVIAVLIFVAWLYAPELKQWLPTHSRTGELRIASNGDMSINSLIIALEYEDGSSHVMNIGVVAKGEPQNYSLPPDMPDGVVNVHVTLDGYGIEKRDLYVMTFYNYRVNELKRDGLLIHFVDNRGMNMYVISGKTKVCYLYNGAYNGFDDFNDWVILANHRQVLSPFPVNIGAGRPFDWTSGWEDNEWEYIEKNE